MSSCSLGVPKINISAINISRGRSGNLLRLNNKAPWLVQRPLKCVGLRIRHQYVKAIHSSAAPKIETSDSKETKSSELTSQLIPKSLEVEALVTEICDSSIAEFELKVGGFRLYVLRNLDDKNSSSQLVPTPVAENASIGEIDTNGSASSPSLAITKLSSSTSERGTLVNKASDESLVILQSPKVGFFRRSRTIKGKRAPPSCKEGDIVKEGQVLCYIEQLGGQIPIESDVSGEVVRIMREDGEPVGYNDALIKILPSFPGIKMLQ